MERQKNSQQENNDSFKNIETIIFHRYKDKDGIYRIDLQNINEVDINTKIISEEINPNEKYVKIYNKSLNEAIKHLRLEKAVTKECAKQVEAATAEYKIRLDASEKRNEVSDKKIEASDKEIKELKIYKHDSQIRAQASDKEIQQLKEQNIVLTNALTKAGLL